MNVLFLGRMELTVSGEFRALPIDNSDVRAEVEGIIDGIYADEGDVVNKGLRLPNSPIEIARPSCARL